jgi:hypothetical protein
MPNIFQLLEFDTLYAVDIGARSESHAANMPEPAVAALWLVGVILMQITRTRPRGGRSPLAGAR